MEAYATLHRAALSMLIRYVLLGGENESLDETMAALGLENKNYAYRCRSDLRRAGLLTRDGKLTLDTPTSSEIPPALLHSGQSFTMPAYQPQSLEVDSIFSAYPQGSILSRIVQADHMDDTGDRSQRNSPFQARRKEQIAVLQEAFSEFWPNPDYTLTESAAKQLLNLAGDCAEAVYEAMETASGRDLTGHPGNYVRGILRKQAEKEKQPSVKLTGLEPTGDYISPVVNPRITAKEERLRKLGKMEPEYDD